MLGKLVVIVGPDKGRAFELADGQTLLIGRGEKTETKLKDPQVSRLHCEVQVQSGRIALVDRGGASGTQLNGKKVKEHDLKPGDIISIGGTQLQLQLEGTPEGTTLVVGAQPTPRPTIEKVGQISDLVGQTLTHYRIDSIIARGENGLVFAAHDTREDRKVALKVLWPEFSNNEEEKQRFIRAIKTMLPLRHPNLISLYGAGKSGPYCYIAMEFIDGDSLTQVIQRIGTAGMLDWRNALRVAIHIGRALEFCEEHQIIHRNIKPSNILIQNSDKLTKLGDVMLAKALEGTRAEQLSKPGELIGDVAYMSPERTRGSSAAVDCRSDIYSLGATVYALLTGRPPFDAGSLPETIMKIRQAEPAKPKKFQLAIPDVFEGCVLKMLAKRPDERFQNASLLVAELERVAKFQGMSF